MRTHGSAMVLPALGLVLVGAAIGVGTALVPSRYRPVGQELVVAVLLLLAVWWSVLPFLRWRNRTYTLTNHRLITREGILSRSGKDLPLVRVNDVSTEQSLTDRLLGCGTLCLQTAAEGALVLDDVPDVEHVHLVLTELMFAPDTRPQVENGWAGQQLEQAAPAEAPGRRRRPARQRRWPRTAIGSSQR